MSADNSDAKSGRETAQTQSQKESGNGSDNQSQDNHGVSKPSHRWHGLSTVVGFLIALHYPALLMVATMGYVDLSLLPRNYFYADIVGWMGVMVYIFGEGTIRSAKAALGKEGKKKPKS